MGIPTVSPVPLLKAVIVVENNDARSNQLPEFYALVGYVII